MGEKKLGKGFKEEGEIEHQRTWENDQFLQMNHTLMTCQMDTKKLEMRQFPRDFHTLSSNLEKKANLLERVFSGKEERKVLR